MYLFISIMKKNIIAEFFLQKQLFISIILAAITQFIFMMFGYKLFLVSILFFILTFFWGVLRTVKSIEKIIHNKR